MRPVTTDSTTNNHLGARKRNGLRGKKNGLAALVASAALHASAVQQLQRNVSQLQLVRVAGGGAGGEGEVPWAVAGFPTVHL